MKRKVSKFKNATFATQIIKKHPLDVPQKKPTHKNFTIPTGKHPRRSPSAINFQTARRATYRKETPKQMPPRVLRNPQEDPF